MLTQAATERSFNPGAMINIPLERMVFSSPTCRDMGLFFSRLPHSSSMKTDPNSRRQ
jgi:hypothetical protein